MSQGPALVSGELEGSPPASQQRRPCPAHLPGVLTFPLNPQSYTLEIALSPRFLRQGPGFMNTVFVSERQQMQ